MKIKPSCFGTFICVTLAIILGGSFICYCKADTYSPNQASILGGILSAIATALLGIIAFWQNKRYKKLADDYNDKLSMPEIFKAESLKERIEETTQATLNKYSFYSAASENRKIIDCGSFSCINAPILNLYIESITYDGKKIQMKEVPHSLLSREASFNIALHIPKTDDSYNGQFSLLFIYENIYGVKYRKNTTFLYTNNLCNNWKFERAKRCD